MSIHHDDASSARPDEQAKGSSQRTTSKSQRTPVQQAALEGGQQSKAGQAARRSDTNDLLNPLSEVAPDPAGVKVGKQPYNQMVEAILETHPLGRLYREMLTGHGLQPPVLSLALLAPVDSNGQIAPFKSHLWGIRQDLSALYPDARDREAALWGVPLPSRWQIEGLRQEIARLHGSEAAQQVERMQLALIKNEGVRNLAAFLHTVEQKIYAWNPRAVWEKESSSSVSCLRAADLYMTALAPLLPISKRDAARNLAVVMWNRRKLVEDFTMLRGSGIQGLQVAEAALMAALANRSPASSIENSQRRDVLAVLNPSNKRFSEDLSRIFNKLELGNNDPHRKFLQQLVLGVRAEHPLETVMQRALYSITDHYTLEDVDNLLRLEFSLLSPNQPKPQEAPGQLEYKLQEFLVASLREYVEASQRNFLMRVSLLQGKDLTDGRTKLVGSDIAKLAELSIILAAIPTAPMEKAVQRDSALRQP
jgi:hypothetical protein